MSTELVSISLYTLLIAYTSVGNLRHWAERRLLALPNERSSHTMPTPSGGGAAIVLPALFGVMIFALLRNQLSPELWILLLGGLGVAGISWMDDLYTIANRTRFAIHLASALLVVVGIGMMGRVALPLLGEVSLGWLGFAITLVWIVGMINAYNFMDGIDGMAGSQAVIAGLAWSLFGYWLENEMIMALGLVLSASSLGFLGYNWPPARIFMGDVGSAFLGYSFAVLGVLASQQHPRMACIALLIVWPFVFDTLFTVVRRWSRGENIFVAHRSHLYQRLVIAGHSHRTVTLLYAGLALIGVLLSMGWYRGVAGCAVAILGGIPALAIGLWIIVMYYETKAALVAPLTQQQKMG